MRLYPPVWEVLACQWWHMTEGEAKQFWAALGRSRYVRPTAMRQRLALIGSMPLDLDDIFLNKLTPQETIATVEDLVHERQLAHYTASHLEKKILEWVDATGAWKAEHLT